MVFYRSTAGRDHSTWSIVGGFAEYTREIWQGNPIILPDLQSNGEKGEEAFESN